MTLPLQTNFGPIWFLQEMQTERTVIGYTHGLDVAYTVVLSETIPVTVPSYYYQVGDRQVERVVQVDKDRVYAMTWDGLYKSTDTGSSFTLIHTWTSARSNETGQLSYRIGPQIYANSLDLYLFGMYLDNNTTSENLWRLDLSTDSVTYINLAGASSNPLRIGWTVWDGKLHWSRATGLPIFGIFDPDTMTATTAVDSNFVNGSNWQQMMFTGEDGGLYIWTVDSQGRPIPGVYDPDYGWYSYSTYVEDPRGANSQVTGLGHVQATFIDPETNNVVLFYPTNLGSVSGSNALTVAYGTAPYTAMTHIASVVIPVSLRHPVDGGYGNYPNIGAPAITVRVHHDTITNPDTPAIFLIISQKVNAGVLNDQLSTVPSVYQWRGIDQEMTYVGNLKLSGFAALSLDRGLHGGMSNVQHSNSMGTVIGIRGSGRNATLTYVVSGDGSTVTARIRYFNVNNGYNGVCQLISGTETSPTSVSGNLIYNITASGSPLEVDWNMTADRCIDGDKNVRFRVEVLE